MVRINEHNMTAVVVVNW